MSSNYTLPAAATTGTAANTAPQIYDATAACQTSNGGTPTGSQHLWQPHSQTQCGFLYNFIAATAELASGTASAGNMANSVCPAGWHLPSGDSSGEFYLLNTAMGNSYTNWLSTGVFAGLFSGNYNGSFYNQGSFGYWWSSAVYSATVGYGAYVSTSSVSPGTDSSKFGGFGVRCVVG